MTTQQLVGEAWYFYAGPVEYYCKFDPDGSVPARFHGPFESRDAAIEKRREWALEQMEIDIDESIF